MDARPGELKRGVLMKQGHVVKSWKERLFVLTSDRLSYFEHEGGKPGQKPKGVILLSDIVSCVAQQGCSFTLSAGDATAAAPVEYALMALTEREKREWVDALQRAMFRPTDAAQALQAMCELQERQLLCSRAQELVRACLGAGTPESVAQANRILALCRAVKPEEHCGDRIESLMLDVTLAQSEGELLALMNSLTLVFVKEYAPPFLRDRLVRLAMTMYERSSSSSRPPQQSGGGAAAVSAGPYPWTPAVQQEFGLVLHAIAVFDHAARLRSLALARQLASKRSVGPDGSALPSSDSGSAPLSPDDEDFGLVTPEDAETDADCLSMCSCECATCLEEEAAAAARAATAATPPLLPTTSGHASDVAAAAVALGGGLPPEDPLKALREPHAFAEDYDLGAKLGEGAYSTVYRGCHRLTGAEVAVKVAPKARLAPADVSRLVEEVLTMASLDHPHIVRLVALYEDDAEFRIVTELMSGGELFDQIVSRSSYGEREACEVVRTLAQAIAYLHGRGIVHRDIKPENVLLTPLTHDPAPAAAATASAALAASVPGSQAEQKRVARPDAGPLSSSSGVHADARGGGRPSAAPLSNSKGSRPELGPISSGGVVINPPPAFVIKIADLGFAKRYTGPPPSPAAVAPAAPAVVAGDAPSLRGAGATAPPATTPPASAPVPVTESAVPATGIFTTSCGTPSYVAPEILKGGAYGAAVDLWSLGVLAYILLCGYAPFSTSSGSQTELFRRIMAGKFAFDAPYWTGISASAKDLISRLLRTNPEKRITAAQVLAHPWIQGAVSSVELSSAVSQLREFQQRKRAVLRCGVLVKQGGFVRNWKLRFFVLTADELQYYDPDDIPLQQQLHPAESVADLGRGAARPRGAIRLKDILSVAPMEPLAPGAGPQFPPPPTAAAPSAAGTAASALQRGSSISSDAGSPRSPSASGGLPAPLSDRRSGSYLSAASPGPDEAAGASRSSLPPLCVGGGAGGDAGDAAAPHSANIVVPRSAAGDFRWGLRLNSTAAAGSREYIVLADSEAARDKWARSIATVNQHGDLVRRAGLAMAMGDAHAKDAVGLMRMAQLWHDTVMSPVAATARSAASPGSTRRRMRRSRHPTPSVPASAAAAESGGSAGGGAALTPRHHVKVCKHTSTSALQVVPQAAAVP